MSNVVNITVKNAFGKYAYSIGLTYYTLFQQWKMHRLLSCFGILFRSFLFTVT
jgi:hypothetical protein